MYIYNTYSTSQSTIWENILRARKIFSRAIHIYIHIYISTIMLQSLERCLGESQTEIKDYTLHIVLLQTLPSLTY